MGMKRSDLPSRVLEVIRRGTVIPATPLALNARRQFDERRQRALMRYYIDAGAGGIAGGDKFFDFGVAEFAFCCAKTELFEFGSVVILNDGEDEIEIGEKFLRRSDFVLFELALVHGDVGFADEIVHCG